MTPPYHARIECLPCCLAADETPRWPPVGAGEHLVSRFDSTHEYRNLLLAMAGGQGAAD